MRKLTYSKPLPRKVCKPKGPTARYRAKRRRAEKPIAGRVRAQCVERDGDCRICDWENNPDDIHDDDLPSGIAWPDRPSEWAHLEEKKRARTRGMTPEQRHTTQRSAMLCGVHHDLYDAGKIALRFLDAALGADGPIAWTNVA